MNINLISNDNGAGLSKDMLILESLLTDHEVERIYYKGTPPPADVNFFIEILIDPRQLSTAKINILIPNLEWFSPKWITTAQRMDAVFCKTRDAETYFLKHGCKAVFTGFTSVDMMARTYLPTKNRMFLHIAGKSVSKGTRELLQAWKTLPDDYTLIVVGAHNLKTDGRNIQHPKYALPDDELKHAMNSCAFHLCPSLAEGWGHYIHEAKSCGAVILTTDADPMNTFIGRRDGFFCKTQLSRPHHAGLFHHPKPESIAEEVRKMAALTDGQIAEMGGRVRADFLLRDKIFRATFMVELDKLIYR